MNIGVVAHIFYRGSILLILRDNIPGIAYPDSWDSVTETLEPREDFDTGMRRGLIEEIGVVPSSLEMIGITRAGHGFFFGTLTSVERRAIMLGSEGQGLGFFGIGQLRSRLRLGGAVRFHLEAYPKAFKKMAIGITPSPAELGLQVSAVPSV